MTKEKKGTGGLKNNPPVPFSVAMSVGEKRNLWLASKYETQVYLTELVNALTIHLGKVGIVCHSG